MNKSDRGTKHVCDNCSTKYYDLMKDVIACPKCGTKPPAPKASRTTGPARKSSRSTYLRFR